MRPPTTRVLLALLVLAISTQRCIASPDSVVTFNELHYNPGAGDSEWIELHNQMAVRIDLSAWEITGGVNFTFPADTIVEPGAFVLVAASPAQVAAALGPWTGSLNNGGERVRLRGRHGRVMDELDYSDSGDWPVGADGSGATLAKKHPEAASLPAASWRASAQDGGTPGAHNFAFGAGDTMVAAIPAHSDWRYETSGTDLGSTWREAGFDDSSWDIGPGNFASSIVRNPSFETDSFTNNPGTISTNSPISGWQSLENGSPGAEGFIGINTPGGVEAFSNNGLVPDGANVAFIRGGPRSIKQDLTGFESGGRYIFRYRENGRAPTSPITEVKLSSEVIVAAHTISNVENSGQFTQPYYHMISRVFTAGASILPLQISNLADIGQSLLIDDVGIDTVTHQDRFENSGDLHGQELEHRPGNETWSSSNPGSFNVQQGTVTKPGAGNATAMLPFSPRPGTRLTLSAEINPGDGSTTKWSGIGFTNSSGTDALDVAGVLWVLLQEDGSVVLHANESGGTGTLSVSSPASSPVYPFNQNAPNDLVLIWDREANHATVLLNGVTVFNSVPLDNNAGGGDGEFSPGVESIAASFTTNNPTFDELFLAEQADPDTALPSHAATTASYFRREFEFSGDPSSANIILDLSVQDGALLWLNGQELLRVNLPAGTVEATTPALSPVGINDTFVLPANLLVDGANVLAIEVHPASGSQAIEFEASLSTLAPLASADIFHPLQLNEIAAAGDANFFVEIKNTGNAPIDLDGVVLELAGVLDASYALPAMSLASGNFFSFDPGFIGADEDRLFLKSSAGALFDAARGKNRLRARLGSAWQYPTASSPGAANPFAISDVVVINEIMYHHRPTYPDSVNGIGYQENSEEWIELHNHSGQAVDLAGWKLRDAITYDFPTGTMLAADGYLVVNNSAFSGSLNNSGERIELRDANDNTVDEVTYSEGGRWPSLADGGGASLELSTPTADNRLPDAWSGSDESAAASWQTFSYSGQGNEPSGNNNPNFFNEFLVGLLDGGEVLIDDVSVIESPDGAAIELVQNGGFESDTIGEQPDKWRILGTHLESRVITDPAGGGGKVLSLRATARLEHSYNLASTTFASNRATNNNATYRISFRARWVSGSPQLNTRLYFNRLARTHIVPQPAVHGTPGEQNSSYRATLLPTIRSVGHSPLVPSSIDAVTVRASVGHKLPLTNVRVFYRSAEGQQSLQSVLMSQSEPGQFVGTIPPHPERSVVEFWVCAEDAEGAQTWFPSDDQAGAFYRIGDGDVGERAVQTIRIIMDPDDAAFMHTAHHTPSNYRYPATVIYNNREMFYNCGVRLRGSSYGRRGGRVGWNIKFPDDQLFRGVHGTIALDGGYSIPRGQGNGFLQVGAGVATNELVYNQMAHRAGGVPATFDDVAFIDAPLDSDDKLAQIKMARFGDIFLESEIGSDQGERFKFELIYHPQATLDGNPESLKNVYNSVRGVDITEMGTDKEAYRHNYWVQNHAGRDDYSRIADMGRAFDSSAGSLKAETDAVIDIDNWMRVLAYQALTGTADTYNNGLAHNLLFYVRPDAERKVMIFPWDVDHGFYYAPTDSIYGRASHRASAVVNIPQNNRLYCGHLLHLCNTGFDPAYIAPWVSHYNQVADLPIAQGYTQWITDRRNHVLGRLNSEHPPVDFQIITNSGNDFSAATPSVELRGDGWIDVRNIILARSGEALTVTWIDSNNWLIDVPLLAGANLIELSAIDHDGNEVGLDSITVTNTGSLEPAAASNLVISEIMYHPTAPSVAEIQAGFTDADAFEFIELRNIGTETIALEGAAFTNGIPFAFQNGLLPPGGHTLVVRDQTAFELRHGAGLPIAGEYGDPADPSGDGGSKLSNGGERLRLQDSGGNAIRDFTYDDNSPWPVGADGGGFSLTLIQPASDPDHSLASSWRTSVVIGGSPAANDATTLADWLTTNGLTDPSADPDGDGLSNFASYALGIDLTGRTGLPTAQLDGSGRFEFSIKKRRAADDVILTPELSTDLLLWQADPGDGSLIQLIDDQSLINGTSHLRFRSKLSSLTYPRQYMRVRIHN